MALTQRSGRSRHRLVLLALTAVTFLTLDFRDFGPLDTAQRAVRDLLEPVVGVGAAVLSPVSDAWNGLFDYDELEAENEALQAELDELRGEQVAAEAEREAFRRLREAVEIDYVDDIPRVAAQVVRTGVGNFDEHVVTIDKGSRDGIDVNMAVVTGAGLVGRVAQVDGSTSRVQLLSDPAMVVGVRLVDIDETGLGSAPGGVPDVIVAERGLTWPEGDDPDRIPAVGTAVVTSSLSRYPADIPVGTVAAATTPDGLSMIVDVALLNDVSDLSYVSVLLAVGTDEVPLREVVPTTTVTLPEELDEESDE